MEKLLEPSFQVLLTSQNASCEDILDYAFDTHPECYVSAGFCRDMALNPRNMHALFLTFDLKDVWSSRFWEQVSLHRFMRVY